MRHPLATLLFLGLSACGDEGPEVTIQGRPVELPASPSATPLPAQLEKLKADGEKAAALGRRALTPADLETYVATLAAWKAAGNDTAKQEAALDVSGLSLLEWRVLDGRVSTLAFALERNMPNEKQAADMATVKPFLERIQAARKAR